MATIELRHIDRIFAGGVKAVDDLCITIESGHFVSLLGPSGCGKTTTLRMIAGLDAPDGGEILLNGELLYSKKAGVAVPTEKRGMGLVFQSYALWPHMTIGQNVAFGLEMKGMDKKQRATRVREVLDLMHISELEKRYPAQISGGQQQRVALARNLAVSPDILLLDEPLSNLDAKLRLEMRAELKRLHETLGNTIIYVTHDQLEAMTMSTMIAVMNEGKLQQYAPPMEIYRKPANLTVAGFVGSPPMNLVHRGDTEESVPWDLGILECFPGRREKTGSIGIRPEDIQLVFPGSRASASDSIPTEWVSRARVETVLPTGSEWIVGMETGGIRFFASSRDEPCCLDRGEVDMLVPLKAIHLFDRGRSRIADE
jgi:iron(III) transport system ATP-binding protein